MQTVFDPDAAEILYEPEAIGSGYWVGAPSVLRHRGQILLTYRRRRPRGIAPDRGYAAYIAVSADGRRFSEVAMLQKEALGTTSIERTALLPEPGGDGWIWLISYVDPADGRWRTDGLRAARLEELPHGQRFPVLSAADIGAEGVKDPVVIRSADGTLYLLLSCAAVRQTGTDPGALHGTHDAFNTGLVSCFTGLASSTDGRSWRWHGPCLLPGTGWDRYQARLSTAIPVGPLWIGLYDGSASVEENYEERLGVAWAQRLDAWQRLTPDGPAVVARSRTGSVRYADLLPTDDGLAVYFECSRPDGSHDLRRAVLRAKVG